MNGNRLSGRERGEKNLAMVRSYLSGLKAAGQVLPFEDGRPNITAIAQACGVLRNVFYTNAGVKRLIAEFINGDGASEEQPAQLARIQRQLEIRDRRILQLEQQLASARAEAEELRSHLAATQQKLGRYKLIEEEILKAGRRVVM